MKMDAFKQREARTVSQMTVYARDTSVDTVDPPYQSHYGGTGLQTSPRGKKRLKDRTTHPDLSSAQPHNRKRPSVRVEARDLTDREHLD
jgi:hypothetical protein